MKRKMLVAAIVLLENSAFSQISFRAQIDSIYLGGSVFHTQKIVSCIDGGFAVTGVTSDTIGNNLVGVIIKFDSTANIEWHRAFSSYAVNEIGNINITPSLDSGFYFEMEPLDDFVMLIATSVIIKLDKFGNVQAIKTSPVGFSGVHLSLLQVEKNTNNLFVMGHTYEYDSFNGGTCCYQSFFAKTDSALNFLFTNKFYNANFPMIAREIYISGLPDGYLLGADTSELSQKLTRQEILAGKNIIMDPLIV